MSYNQNDSGILHCSRCQASWRQRAEERPIKCPKCQSRHWNAPPATVLSTIGPPPQGLAGMGDKHLLLQVSNIHELRRQVTDVLDAAEWTSQGLAEAQKQIHRVKVYAASAVEILSTLYEAGKIPALAAGPTPTLELQPELPIPLEPVQQTNTEPASSSQPEQKPKPRARKPSQAKRTLRLGSIQKRVQKGAKVTRK